MTIAGDAMKCFCKLVWHQHKQTDRQRHAA